MGLSRLCEQCRKCPRVDTCNHKKMEHLALAEPPKATNNIAAGGTLSNKTVKNFCSSVFFNEEYIIPKAITKNINESIIKGLVKSQRFMG